MFCQTNFRSFEEGGLRSLDVYLDDIRRGQPQFLDCRVEPPARYRFRFGGKPKLPSSGSRLTAGDGCQSAACRRQVVYLKHSFAILISDCIRHDEDFRRRMSQVHVASELLQVVGHWFESDDG